MRREARRCHFLGLYGDVVVMLDRLMNGCHDCTSLASQSQTLETNADLFTGEHELRFADGQNVAVEQLGPHDSVPINVRGKSSRTFQTNTTPSARSSIMH